MTSSHLAKHPAVPWTIAVLAIAFGGLSCYMATEDEHPQEETEQVETTIIFDGLLYEEHTVGSWKGQVIFNGLVTLTEDTETGESYIRIPFIYERRVSMERKGKTPKKIKATVISPVRSDQEDPSPVEPVLKNPEPGVSALGGKVYRLALNAVPAAPLLSRIEQTPPYANRFLVSYLLFQEHQQACSVLVTVDVLPPAPSVEDLELGFHRWHHVTLSRGLIPPSLCDWVANTRLRFQVTRDGRFRSTWQSPPGIRWQSDEQLYPWAIAGFLRATQGWHLQTDGEFIPRLM